MIIGVDASRCRSGGAISHVRGLFSSSEPNLCGIKKIYLWGEKSLLSELPIYPWLVKVEVAFKSNIMLEFIWQFFILPRDAKIKKIDLMFNLDSGSVCPFKPAVTLNQDLLSFEPGEINRYPLLSRARLRLLLLKYLHKASIERSEFAIFLSRYARDVISKKVNIRHSFIVNHGVNPLFLEYNREPRFDFKENKAINILYVSNIAPYKHHANVLRAVDFLRRETGKNLHLHFVGGGDSALIKPAMNNQTSTFLTVDDFVAVDEVVKMMAQADIFVFASSCEAFGITLLEAMALGLPICCSNKSSLPEVAGDTVLYFNPEDYSDIASSLLVMIEQPELRNYLSKVARQRARMFNWEDVSTKTWGLLSSFRK